MVFPLAFSGTLLLAALVGLVQHSQAAWTPEDLLRVKTQLPDWKDAPRVEVFFLEASLSAADPKIGNFLEGKGGWHTGVGFRRPDTDEFLYLEFYALIPMAAAVFPNISTDRTQLSWNDHAVLGFKHNTTAFVEAEQYWVRTDYTGSITGAVFDQYTCWAPTFIQTSHVYQLFDVIDAKPITHRYIAAETCASFA
jgi:hypothetical protein